MNAGDKVIVTKGACYGRGVRDGSYDGILFTYVCEQGDQVVLEVFGYFETKHHSPWERREKIVINKSKGWEIGKASDEILRLALTPKQESKTR